MLKRREFLNALAASAAGALLPKAFGQARDLGDGIERLVPTLRGPSDPALYFQTGAMIGRVTDFDAVVNLVTASNLPQQVLTRVRWASDITELPTSPHVSPIVTGMMPSAAIELPISGLSPNARYACRVEYAAAQSPQQWHVLEPATTFQSQKNAGRTFSFAVMGDAHWGQVGNVPRNGARWHAGINTMKEIARADCHDFTVELGDAPFPSVVSYDAALQKYVEYREYIAAVAQRMPIYMALGNHECEAGFYQRGTDDPAEQGALWNRLTAEQYRQLWCTQARQTCIPNPRGDTYPEGGEGAPGYDSFADWFGVAGPWNEGAPRSHLQNFYAWTWGDALFIVLDPFRYTRVGSVWFPNSPSQYSLGPTQMQWLEDVLASSTATWKFIFAHHQVGGGLINRAGHLIEDGGDGYAYGRGSAIEAARPETEQARIHELMLLHNVQFFVYGHDHGFTHSLLDGIHYLGCGRPTHLNDWWPNSGMIDSYGDLLLHGLDKSWMRGLFNVVGYVAFHVEPQRVTLQWIRTGYSFAPYPSSPRLARRDWLESWAGCVYDVDSPDSVTVRLQPKRVDGVRTLAGAEIPAIFEPPNGTDYQRLQAELQPGVLSAHTIPLNGFPESAAVVDAIPEVVYEQTFQVY